MSGIGRRAPPVPGGPSRGWTHDTSVPNDGPFGGRTGRVRILPGDGGAPLLPENAHDVVRPRLLARDDSLPPVEF